METKKIREKCREIKRGYKTNYIDEKRYFEDAYHLSISMILSDHLDRLKFLDLGVQKLDTSGNNYAKAKIVYGDYEKKYVELTFIQKEIHRIKGDMTYYLIEKMNDMAKIIQDVWEEE